MSLSDEQWDALQLDIAVVRARAAFFVGYARSEAPLFEVSGLIQAFRDGPLAEDPGHLVVKLTDSDRAGVLRRRLAEAAEQPRYAPWVRTAERADALRQAAQALLLADSGAGRRLLLGSANLYRDVGIPFGAFLIAAASGPGEVAFEAGRRLRSFILDAETPPEVAEFPGEAPVRQAFPDVGTERAIPLRHALRAPAQQIAVLFTALSTAEAVGEFHIDSGSLGRAPQATQPAAVGVTGRPVALWWECGVRLAELVSGRAAARDDLRATIAELATAHGQALRTAQYDRYHWPRAASRTDLVDLDLAGLTAVSNRLLRQLGESSWDLLDDFRDLSALSQVSLQVGVALSGRGGTGTTPSGPPPEPRPGPRAVHRYGSASP